MRQSHNNAINEEQMMENITNDLENIRTIEANKHNMAWIQVKDNHNGFIKEYGALTNYGAPTPLSEFTVEMVLYRANEEAVTILQYKTI